MLTRAQQTLVITNSNALEQNKYFNQLQEGQIGAFDITTHKSIDFNYANIYNTIFAVGVKGGGAGISADRKPGDTFITCEYFQQVDYTPATFTIDQTKDFKADTSYTFTIDFSDYKIFGFNTLKQSFSILTPKNLQQSNEGKKEVVNKFVYVINKNPLFSAINDNNNSTHKIKVTISPNNEQRVFNPKVTLVEGFDETATVSFTDAKFGIGDFDHVRKLELISAGYDGHNYPIYNLTGTHDVPFLSQPGKKYKLINLYYSNSENTYGFRGTFNHTVTLAFESTIADSNNIFTKLKDKQ